MTARRRDPVEGEEGSKARALRRLEALNSGRVFYRMVFADAQVPARDLAEVADFLSAD